MSEQNPKQTIYVTKYALTAGPFAVEAKVSEDGKFASWSDDCYQTAYGNEWHSTKDAALEDCERRRKAKQASIEKQRQKLAEMEFKL